VLKAKRAEGAPVTGEAAARVPSAPKKAAQKSSKLTVTPPVGNTGGKLPLKPQKSSRGRNV
jgi:hypothetical protein